MLIHNSLSKQKETFTPIHPGEVRMYVCGMTVYDLCHIGHGRIFVVFDMVARYLRYRGYKVTYVRNITDVDDKIIKRANENNESIDELTERTIKAMFEDEATLGVQKPDMVPRATKHIDDIIAMIATLVEKQNAYVADDGDVYFSVSSFPEYGKLAHQDLESLQAGHRVDVLDVKRNPLDFALWKLAKPNEPSWDSPWGAGRPGWHIECSAMSEKTLGKHFDIHGGGMDLPFPHHQNEIAQSEAAHGCKYVNTWMHVGYVQINEEKMSKSLGNFFTIREVVKNYNPEVIRYFMLASHYRSPINYSKNNLESAKAALTRFYASLRDLPNISECKDERSEQYEQRYQAAMDDDFNTPVALAVLFDMVREINQLKDHNDIDSAAQLATQLKRLASVFGLLQLSPEEFLRSGVDQDEAKKIEELIVQRNIARAEKNWGEADKIRDQLSSMGVVLEDKAGQTVWRKEG